MANSLLTVIPDRSVIPNRPAMPDRGDVPDQPVVPTRPRSAREELAERTRALLLEAETAGPLRRQQLLDEVITSHLWLAEKLARQFRHRGVDDDDLVQVARTGLVEACLRSIPIKVHLSGLRNPPSAECSSDTFVIMAGPFAPHGRLRSSPRASGDGGRRWFRRWAACRGTRDLADELGVPVDAVQQARMASEGYSALSIDTAMSRGVCFFSSESDDDRDRMETRLIIDRAVARLEESERRLIWLRFFEQRSQSDIADERRASRRRMEVQVSRLLSRLLLKLRSMMGEPEKVATAS